MPSFLEYVDKFGKLPKVLTMSFAAYIAFYSDCLLKREADGIIAKRPQGDEYKIQDDAWVLDFYWEHRDDSVEDLVHAVMTNEKMWGQDLSKVESFEAAAVANLKLIREKGALAAYKSVL